MQVSTSRFTLPPVGEGGHRSSRFKSPEGLLKRGHPSPGREEPTISKLSFEMVTEHSFSVMLALPGEEGLVQVDEALLATGPLHQEAVGR